MNGLFDKRGIPIERGDVVKVFHFTGAHRKRHFMYKQAVGIVETKQGEPAGYMRFSHLDLGDEYYVERCDGRTLPNYEIIQSIDCKFDERPRAGRAASPNLPEGEK